MKLPNVSNTLLIVMGAIVLTCAAVALAGSAQTLSYLNKTKDPAAAGVEGWQRLFVVIWTLFVVVGAGALGFGLYRFIAPRVAGAVQNPAMLAAVA